MKTIAIISAVGGAGRTTITAELASLLRWHGHAPLAIECDPRGLLGFHFGLREPVRQGLSNSADWPACGHRSDDGVLFVPWGEPGARAARADIAMRLHEDPHWLRRLLLDVALAGDAVTLVDSAPWPSPFAEQALAAADLALVLLPSLPESCATLAPLRQALDDGSIASAYVVTRLQPGRQLHTDVSVLLRATLGDALLPYEIHEDAGVPEALARGECFCRSTPHSQTAHDLQGLASWVSGWLLNGARAGKGQAGGQVPRGVAP
ncbi:cellulose biosynthesis protein BcsQ [Cupriavidus pinatubonensis]